MFLWVIKWLSQVKACLALLNVARVLAVALCVSLSGLAHAELKISGSDTLESYFQDAVSQFTRGVSPAIPVSASYKGTGAGFRDLCDGRVGIAPASAQIDTESAKRCADNRVAYVEMPLAFDAIVVIAHPSRAAAGELSMAELKAIFHPENAGKVTRWSQVRANLPDTPITVVSLDPKSGTNAFFGSKVHGLRGFVRPDAKISADHNEVIRMVANDPNAIGFVSLGVLSESKAAVWRVPMNFGNGPVVPSKEAVLNGSYGTFSRVLYVYVSKAALAERDSHTLQFSTWLMERGAKLATYEGLIPLIEQNYQDNLRKLSGR